MGDESQQVAAHITSKLAADTSGAGSLGVLSSGITGRIYDSLGDQGELTYPLIVFNWQAGTDLNQIGAIRVGTNAVLLVKVIGKGQTFLELSPIYGRVDTLIHRTSGTGVLSFYRETAIRYPETRNGVTYRHLGGLYRSFALAA